MTEFVTNPTSAEQKFLVPFQIGSEKIVLYGSPISMQLRSELIKALMDKLTPGVTVTLLPDEKVNPNSLLFLMNKLNGISAT